MDWAEPHVVIDVLLRAKKKLSERDFETSKLGEIEISPHLGVQKLSQLAQF